MGFMGGLLGPYMDNGPFLLRLPRVGVLGFHCFR